MIEKSMINNYVNRVIKTSNYPIKKHCRMIKLELVENIPVKISFEIDTNKAIDFMKYKWDLPVITINNLPAEELQTGYQHKYQIIIIDRFTNEMNVHEMIEEKGRRSIF